MTTTNRILSLQAAADYCGFSLGKFRYPKNKTALIAAGATVNTEGHWRIPLSALEAIGWVGVKPSKTDIAPPSPLEIAELRIVELESELLALHENTARRSLFGRKRK